MKPNARLILGFFGLFFMVAEYQKRVRADDAWDLWNSKTTKLWGANIYQEVVPATDKCKRSWGPLLRPHDFADLARAGANYVNLSVPGPFEPGNGNLNKDDWEFLQERIKWAKCAKLKVVISFRTGPGRNEADITKPFTNGVIRDLLDDPNSPSVRKFCDMWKMVAIKYKGDPDVVGFDLLVEPHASKNWEKDQYHGYNFREKKSWYKVAQQAIDAIRKQNIKTPILVEPDLWAAAVYLNKTDGKKPKDKELAWEMPKGECLVCAVHQYEPSNYTENGTENFDVEFVSLRQAFDEIRIWRTAKKNEKSPVCVNEFGLKQRLPYAELFLTKELRLLKNQELNHAVWLWEVTDPKYDYRDFDVRSNPKLLRALMANWSQNSEDQGDRQAPAVKKGKR